MSQKKKRHEKYAQVNLQSIFITILTKWTSLPINIGNMMGDTYNSMSIMYESLNGKCIFLWFRKPNKSVNSFKMLSI